MPTEEEEWERLSMDLADLTRRETNSILHGEEPSEKLIRIIGGGKESDNSVRRNYVIAVRDTAFWRLQSAFTLNNAKQSIKQNIDELDAFIANLPLN